MKFLLHLTIFMIKIFNFINKTFLYYVIQYVNIISIKIYYFTIYFINMFFSSFLTTNLIL